MKRILSILLVGIMLVGLTACNQSSDKPNVTEPNALSYSIYVPNDNADGFHVLTVDTADISAETVLAELKARGVLPDAVAINRFNIEQGLITLDFNQAFADVVCSMGTSGELMIVGSVVNTFLDAFQAETVYFTVDGQILESGHTIYDFALSFFSVDSQSDATGSRNEVPYVQRIAHSDQSIYDGPGYDYIFVGTIQQRGAYTIVAEVEDFEGNLWGKLKSGIGWVDLTEIRSEAYINSLLSANYADETLLLHGTYHHYANDDDYAVSIAFRAYGKLQNVTLFDVQFNDENHMTETDIFTIPEMTEDMPLVAELAFPGDMSMYGIRFVDETDRSHTYNIYISGRNGALILVEA